MFQIVSKFFTKTGVSPNVINFFNSPSYRSLGKPRNETKILFLGGHIPKHSVRTFFIVMMQPS